MFTTKKMTIATCMLIAMFNPRYLSATHVVVISGQQIFMQSAEGKAVQNTLQKLQESFVSAFQSMHMEIEKLEKTLDSLLKKAKPLYEELQSNVKMLSESAKLQKTDLFNKLQEEIKDAESLLKRQVDKRNNYAKEADEKMKMKQNELTMPLNQKFQETVEKVAKKEKCDVVLMKEQCIFVGESTDKTDLVIAMLDEEYNKAKTKENADKAKILNDKK